MVWERTSWARPCLRPPALCLKRLSVAASYLPPAVSSAASLTLTFRTSSGLFIHKRDLKILPIAKQMFGGEKGAI